MCESEHACNSVMRHKAQNSQSSSSSIDSMAQVNLSRRVFEKNFSIGTLNFLAKTTVRRGSM
jgi:hypothetical protein